jgi:hypothetical protein
MLEWATFIMATVAAVGGLVRVAQDERSFFVLSRSARKMAVWHMVLGCLAG